MTALFDPDVLPLLKEKAAFCASLIPQLEPTARDTLLSFLYFSSEAEYMTLYPCHTPPRLIGEDAAFDAIAFFEVAPDFVATQAQISDQFLEYSCSKSPKDLDVMISTCAAALNRHSLPIVNQMQCHVI